MTHWFPAFSQLNLSDKAVIGLSIDILHSSSRFRDAVSVTLASLALRTVVDRCGLATTATEPDAVDKAPTRLVPDTDTDTDTDAAPAAVMSELMFCLEEELSGEK